MYLFSLSRTGPIYKSTSIYTLFADIITASYKKVFVENRLKLTKNKSGKRIRL